MAFMFLWVSGLMLLEGPLDQVQASFLNADKAAFRALLNSNQRVVVDLQPLMPFKGEVAASQTALIFSAFEDRFRVVGTRWLSISGDTNYSRLECVLLLELLDAHKTPFRAVFDLRFHIYDEQLGLNHWTCLRVE
ncbi:MAG: hypothetical protein KDC35_01935 [Acidobacteria bacterium]|nr:hypothetical protein [Acidobacteriota bacterium]